MGKVKNLRRIPTGEVLESKEISFKLYIKLQHISKRNPEDTVNEHRFVPCNLFNKSNLAKELKVTRQTIIKKFKGLEKCKLIKNITTHASEYLILPNKGEHYVLLNDECIELLLGSCDEYCIRIFLLHKAYTNKYGKHYLTLTKIAKEVGLSKTHLQKIIDANRILQSLGMLEINKEWEYKNGKTKENNCYKTLK